MCVCFCCCVTFAKSHKLSVRMAKIQHRYPSRYLWHQSHKKSHTEGEFKTWANIFISPQQKRDVCPFPYLTKSGFRASQILFRHSAITSLLRHTHRKALMPKNEAKTVNAHRKINKGRSLFLLLSNNEFQQLKSCFMTL